MSITVLFSLTFIHELRLSRLHFLRAPLSAWHGRDVEFTVKSHVGWTYTSTTNSCCSLAVFCFLAARRRLCMLPRVQYDSPTSTGFLTARRGLRILSRHHYDSRSSTGLKHMRTGKPDRPKHGYYRAMLGCTRDLYVDCLSKTLAHLRYRSQC